jgi:hypothetical protein
MIYPRQRSVSTDRAERGDPVDHPQHEEDREGNHPGHDLVLRHARDQQTEGDEAAAHEQHAQVGRGHRLPFRVAEREQHAEMDQGHREHCRIQRHRPQELAHDDLEIGERRRQ